jgi:DNA (cytosine-5)-methyltransferase 1
MCGPFSCHQKDNRMNEPPRIGSLFSGAGGLDLAVEAVFGGHTVWHSEIDPAASKVLAHRWPSVPNLGDITKVDWADVPAVDILCGGFPCQDVSAAGKRAGIKDGTRSGLWSVFAEAIEALQPRIVVVENVRGLLSATAHRDMEPDDAAMGIGGGVPVLRAAGAVVGTLSDLGYSSRWATVSAASVGAPHRRERVFIIATDSSRIGRAGCDESRQDMVSDRPEPAHVGASRGDIELLPTPRSSDCFGAGLHGDGGMDLRTTVTLLPTPTQGDGSGGGRRTVRVGKHQPGKTSTFCDSLRDAVLAPVASQWGKYEPAIRRWEQLTRPAPAPTEPNKNGNPRLSAAFSEWLMGWPQGWVTDPAIGISRNDQLRIIGNGVVSIQAVAALRHLLNVAALTA